MKKILLILLMAIQANAYICDWVQWDQDCMPGAIYGYNTGTLLENQLRLVQQCQNFGVEIRTFTNPGNASGVCVANGGTFTTRIQIGSIRSSSSMGSSSSYYSSATITDEERLESFKGGLYLVLLAFLVAAPIGVAVMLLKRSV